MKKMGKVIITLWFGISLCTGSLHSKSWPSFTCATTGCFHHAVRVCKKMCKRILHTNCYGVVLDEDNSGCWGLTCLQMYKYFCAGKPDPAGTDACAEYDEEDCSPPPKVLEAFINLPMFSKGENQTAQFNNLCLRMKHKNTTSLGFDTRRKNSHFLELP